MNIVRGIRLLFAALWVVAVVGCATCGSRRAEGLVTPLPKLTAAVDALVRYPDPANPVSDDRLVAEAMKNKPELQRAFQGLPIKVRHDAKYVVLLVCSPDGKHAWLEDASWTLGVDYKWYLSKPLPPPEFTMEPTQGQPTQ